VTTHSAKKTAKKKVPAKEAAAHRSTGRRFTLSSSKNTSTARDSTIDTWDFGWIATAVVSDDRLCTLDDQGLVHGPARRNRRAAGSPFSALAALARGDGCVAATRSVPQSGSSRRLKYSPRRAYRTFSTITA
jgi:hypothetical protein